MSEEIEGAKQYYIYKERCVFCDVIRQETETGARVVAENADFITLAPYAPRFPFRDLDPSQTARVGVREFFHPHV